MEQKKLNKKVLEGVVVSNKMQKTIVVKVTRRKPHPKYKKIISLSKKFKVHVEDDTNKPEIGKKVQIQQSKPISKDKSWVIINK